MQRNHWLLVGITGVLATIAIIWQIWNQVSSFAIITFTFDTPQGNARLIHPRGDIQNITPNTPMKLKKGTYTLTTGGDGFAATAKELTIDTSHTVPVNFSLATARLQALLAKEKDAIDRTITDTYPTLPTLYTIHHEALYGKGDIYGATLRFIDTASDQRDTLHILLQKQHSTWQVRSTPPVPVLSAPHYPDIPIDILRAINLGE